MAKKMNIKLRAYDHALLDETAVQVVATCKAEGATVAGPIPMPTEKTIYTVIRATHKYKKSREQFEKRVHRRLIQLTDPSEKLVDQLTRVALPAGVEIEIKL